MQLHKCVRAVRSLKPTAMTVAVPCAQGTPCDVVSTAATRIVCKVRRRSFRPDVRSEWPAGRGVRAQWWYDSSIRTGIDQVATLRALPSFPGLPDGEAHMPHFEAMRKIGETMGTR
eukprot:4868229-Prymnesium_polylepis.1